MEPDQFQRLRRIFHEALDLDPHEVASHLDRACQGDPALRVEAERLLATASDDDGFLTEPAVVRIAGAEPFRPGRTIGPYRLTRRIASGGTGTVYEAEQADLGRSVAVKVMHRGLLSEAAVRRFEYEAEILAHLRHPNIARVIESGTSGTELRVPYFVMEFIPGARPITEYARENHLGVRQRLALFTQACDALHHAHLRGIIHRDLKPTNILVDEVGQVKVIDFGVARAVDSELSPTTMLTAAGDLIGTIQYMSPEQCLADPSDLDIRSDVYALGVVLYELVCEELPYDVRQAALLEGLRLIQTQPPRRPSTIRRQLKGDLENILLKALEKNREQRYQTLSDFGADVSRYLRGEVVRARTASPLVHFWKYLKRNPGISTAAGGTLLAVGIFVAYLLLWSLPVLQAETARAEEARQQARADQHAALLQTRTAEERYQEITRLKDLREIVRLEEEDESLWPAYPRNIPRMEGWISRAESLLARQPLHRAALKSIQVRALPYDEAARARNRESHERWWELSEMRRSRDYALETIRSLEAREAAGDRDSAGVRRLEKFRALLARRTEQIAELSQELEVRRTWEFADPVLSWQHERMLELISRLEHLDGEGDGSLRRMQARLAMAKTLAEESLARHQAEWSRAIASIADRRECPAYEGLVIDPQMGLVPLGPDPDSGLWEFAHLQTGTAPPRGPRGRLEINEETALVFVLIPGGTFRMGAVQPSKDRPVGSPNVDPGARFYEGPVHTVTVGPFLLSKYEMTQGQWLRFTGHNPSSYPPDDGSAEITLRHPVESVSWDDCQRELSRMGLRLPSEAEWEYACRAGTTTVYWNGDSIESLEGNANLFNQGHRELRPGEQPLWNDPWPWHAPVGLLAPNPFGLHNLFGNIFEWCQDTFGSYEDTPRDGSPFESSHGETRMARGSSWDGLRSNARSAARVWECSGFLYISLGVRPAASLN
ncbi:MAG: SUMF1/EgtB/PvdO family nonheme iron enzyme [Candidatus Eisenbacteria bacterium]|nr:SUMF1/EgtB/PvdO family nonheme iron enzyme [Candidatus Eisenbacteria bacterium]